MDRLRNCISPLAMEVFRIAFGVLLFVDLAMRYLDLEAHYTVRGVFPLRIGFWDYLLQSGRLDVFLLADSSFFHHLLFLVGLGASVCFCLGLFVRPAQVIIWLVLLGAQNQNPLLNAGADIYVRVILFWSFFLPLGRSLSVAKSKRNSQARLPSPVEALGFYAYSAQIGVAYLCSFLVKWQTPYWPAGKALGLALQIDNVRGPLADTLLLFPQILTVLTYITLCLQFAAAVLLVIPPHHLLRTRTLILIALTCMHVGIMGSLSVGLFPYYAVASLIPLLPRSLMLWKQDRVFASRRADAGRRALLTGSLQWVKLAGVAFGVLFVPLHLLSLSIEFPPGPTRVLERLGRFTGLHQEWVMFSAIEFNLYGKALGCRSDGAAEILFEIPRLSASSRPWDITETPPVPYEFPSAFSSYRWKKYSVRVFGMENRKLLRDLTTFLCRDTDRRSGSGYFSQVRYTCWKERRDWKSDRVLLDSSFDEVYPCPPPHRPLQETAGLAGEGQR